MYERKDYDVGDDESDDDSDCYGLRDVRLGNKRDKPELHDANSHSDWLRQLQLYCIQFLGWGDC